MKKLILSLLALPLLFPVSAFGQDQYAAKSNTSKAITISGRVSADGKNLIATNGESWSVANPDALAGHENQQVKVKCQISSATRDIRVISLRTVATPVAYHANPGDSAFRR